MTVYADSVSPPSRFGSIVGYRLSALQIAALVIAGILVVTVLVGLMSGSGNTAAQVAWWLVLITVALLLYFTPGLIASSAGKRNTSAIWAANFFLGWTFLGWVVVFEWAMTKDRD